ncbi:MAG: YjiH family protein [Anaerofustis sp.]
METAKKLSSKSIAKFIVCSILGIIVFFVKLPLGESSQIPINWIVNLLKANFAAYIPYIVLIAGLYGLYDCIIIQKSYKKPVDILFTLFKIIGMLCIVFSLFHFGPAFILAEGVGPNVLNVLSKAVALTVLIGSLLLPLLIDYGLASAVGVLIRPIWRPLFKLPGRTAVASVTSYLANYPIGHMAINQMYREGQITVKESFIVCTGFATASIVNYMVFAQLLDIMDQWGIYFLLVTLLTCIITAIQVRLYPTRNKSNEYYQGATPDPEPEYNKNILRKAFEEGVTAAEKADPIGKKFVQQLKMGFTILARIVPIATFYMVAGILLNTYTPIFTWVGYIFWPFFKLMGYQDLAALIPATGMSIVDLMMVVTTGAKALAIGGLTMTSRFFLAALPVTCIVFLSGFVPSIMAIDVPSKFHELIVIWLIRVILSIVLIGLFGLIFL